MLCLLSTHRATEVCFSILLVALPWSIILSPRPSAFSLLIMSWCFGCCVARLESIVLDPPMRNEKFDNVGEGAWPPRFDLKKGYQPQGSLPKWRWLDGSEQALISLVQAFIGIKWIILPHSRQDRHEASSHSLDREIHGKKCNVHSAPTVVSYRRMVGEPCSRVWQTRFSVRGGFARQGTDHAVSLGAETTRYARSETARSVVEIGTIGPGVCVCLRW